MGNRSYKQFYALLRQNQRIDKDEIVLQFTDGRTSRLTEMSDAEYNEMIRTLSRDCSPSAVQERSEIRRWRSSALLRLGRLGISTIDNWDGINAFVSSPRIAGKAFYDLSVVELQELVRKLEMIQRNGGLKARPREGDPAGDERPAYAPQGVVIRITPSGPMS